MEQFEHEMCNGLRQAALALPETSEGTSCVNRAFKVRKKNFLFVGEKGDQIRVIMRDRLSHGYLPPHEPFECPVLAVTVGVRGLMDKGGEEALGECTVAMEEELKHVAGEA